MKFLFQFFGGIYLAIFLLFVSALLVIIGTIIESRTSSHLFAAEWIYSHPAFYLLLSLFFINILFSALRRWPFKRKHIPFLLTHLGLLLVITGVFFKSLFGLQGHLFILEGSGSQDALLLNTQGVWIEKNTPFAYSESKQLIALKDFENQLFHQLTAENLKLKLIGYYPHVRQQLETWFKSHYLDLSHCGVPIFAFRSWSKNDDLPALFTTINEQALHLIAIETKDIQEAIESIYLQDLVLKIEKKNKTTSVTIPLKEALSHSINFSNGSCRMNLNCSFVSPEDIQLANLSIRWKSNETDRIEYVKIPLTGKNSLECQLDSKSWLEPSFQIDLFRSFPTIAFIKTEQNEGLILVVDCHGRLYVQPASSQFHSMIAYDRGFQGYAIQTALPLPNFSAGRKDKEESFKETLIQQLNLMAKKNLSLSPPLQFLKKACERAETDFFSVLVEFLFEWNQTTGLLFSSDVQNAALRSTLETLDWKENVSVNDQQASLWTERLFTQLEGAKERGEELLPTLKNNHWPLVKELLENQRDESDPLFSLFIEQLDQVIPLLPPLPIQLPFSLLEKARLLSAYLFLYGIHYSIFFPKPQNWQEEEFDCLEMYWKKRLKNFEEIRSTLTLETPITYQLINEQPSVKLEDLCPGILLEVKKGLDKQLIALPFDRTGMGLKWPILNGNYLLRFQPMHVKLPYRLRLRQARQLLYPQSDQTYSYECDLLISNSNNELQEQTLSMNRVYETKEGYRFYLSGVGQGPSKEIKRIQLIVNYDPTKYFLTYPGALLVFIGIIWLFWFGPQNYAEK